MGIYPNPVFNSALISHSKASEGASLTVLSVDGKIIATYGIQTGATKTSIDVSRLAKGTYFVSFEDNDSQATAQFVK